jgi:hypothetical protein
LSCAVWLRAFTPNCSYTDFQNLTSYLTSEEEPTAIFEPKFMVVFQLAASNLAYKKIDKQRWSTALYVVIFSYGKSQIRSFYLRFKLSKVIF